jgi:hypothetical protein
VRILKLIGNNESRIGNHVSVPKILEVLEVLEVPEVAKE